MMVLVTGATGAVGLKVVMALYQSGYQIRIFSIDVPEAGMFPQDVEILFGDVTDKDAVQYAMQGVGAVVHMAAHLHVVNPSSGLREKYEHVNVRGTATVVEAAIKAGVKRVVLFSTIVVYGCENGRVFDEDSPTQPETDYAQTKLAAEEIVLNARRADGDPIGNVLRLGAVYGSRIKGNYERMVCAIAHNRFIPIGDGLNRRTLVYDKDVAKATVLAVEHPAAAGRIYNVTDGNFHTLNDIISAICSALGRNPPRLSLPVAPVRFAAVILEDGARLCGLRSPIVRATIDKYTEDIAVESARIQKELGFVPQYDLDTGWREAIREMRERGIL
jgi:nucleoside-diphosphate-sugar epimerase